MLINKVLEICNYVDNQLTKHYGQYDLTINQATILLYLYNSDINQINANIIANELAIDKRTMSLSLKSLEKKNYIVRHINAVDSRQKDIELSLNGLEICEDIAIIKEEVNSIMLHKLTKQQITEIESINLTK